MDYNYTLLGLREDATLENAKEAYEYWKKKYKTADFYDEPEYAKRKIAQLTEAYTNVCRSIAGYVPADVQRDTTAKGRPKGLHPKKLSEFRDDISRNHIESDNRIKSDHHSESKGMAFLGGAGFLEGLKSAAKDFLDEMDLENGYAPSFAAGQDDDDYDDMSDEE